MDGQWGIWLAGWTGSGISGWIDGRVVGGSGWMDGRAVGYLAGWMDGQWGIWLDGWTGSGYLAGYLAVCLLSVWVVDFMVG